MSPKANAKYVPQKSSSTMTYVFGAIALVVIAAVVIGGVLWQNSRNKPRNEGYGSVQNPAVQVQLADDGTIRLGQPNAPVTISIFEDALCPFCGELEKKHGQEIAQKIDDGDIAVEYHLMNILDSLSHSGNYSSRAVAAAQCVAAAGDGPAFGKFHDELFAPANQPAERGSSDHTNDELAAFAKDAGANDTAVACIASGERVAGVAGAANGALVALTQAGGQGTPTVIENGSIIDTTDNDWVSNLN